MIDGRDLRSQRTVEPLVGMRKSVAIVAGLPDLILMASELLPNRSVSGFRFKPIAEYTFDFAGGIGFPLRIRWFPKVFSVVSGTRLS